jgi:hypothetical protein
MEKDFSIMNSRSMQMMILAARRTLGIGVICLSAIALSAAVPKLERDPVIFSIPGGVYTNDLQVELRADGAVVRFTTDGSEPTANSPVYKTPITISQCSMLRARAFYADGRVSRPATQSYVLLANDLRRFSSHLPLIVVNAPGGEIESGDKSFAGLHVLENQPERTTLPDRADFTGSALVGLRGFSSLRYPKHSFAVKIVNDLREPQKISILRMPRESDWVLYGPYPDKTLLRDVLAYELAGAMGEWAPRTRYVEVFLNEQRGKLSMENYIGLYVFEEKVTRDKARVNITKLDPGDTREPDITGGYIFKKDHAERGRRVRWDADGPPMVMTPTSRGGFPTPAGGFPADPAGFLPPFSGESSLRNTGRTPGGRAPRGLDRVPFAPRPVTNYIAGVSREMVRLDDTEIFPEAEAFTTPLQRNVFYYVDPEPDEITAVQRAWLKDYLNRFEAALYGPDFADPKKGYPAFIDRDSFIDFHLFSEVTKNVDSFRFSTFYHKQRGERLKMGPVWDWNLSFGNCDGKQGYMPERWLWPQLNDQEYSWFRRLFEDPDFGQRYVDRWGELRQHLFATSNMMMRIDALVAQIGEAQERNFKRWPILGREINPNYFVGDTYQEEIDWMKRWTSNRLAWIEKQFLPAPTMQRGPQLTLATTTTNSNAQIYFTLDGTDPRAPGGEAAAQAKIYQSPLAAPKDAKLFARTRAGQRWSPPTIQP